MLLLKHNVVFLIKSNTLKNYNPFLYLIYIGIKFGIYFAHSFKIHKIGLIMSIEFVGMVFLTNGLKPKEHELAIKLTLNIYVTTHGHMNMRVLIKS